MLQDIVPNLEEFEKVISEMATSGYVFALNVKHITPQISHVRYPEEWWDEYMTNRYHLFDPIVKWGVLNNGCKRWSEIVESSILYSGSLVMTRSREHGLNYGVSITRKSNAGKKMKSFFTASRHDREFTDEELDHLGAIFEEIATQVENVNLLSDLEIEALELAAKGLSHKQIGDHLGKSADAIKKRLESARKTMRTSSTIEAILKAHARNLIKLNPEF